jgi:hypothetical protein
MLVAMSTARIKTCSGRNCLERASIPNLLVCWQHKIVLGVVVSKILIGADQIQKLSFLFGRCEREKDFVSVSISVTKKCQGARVGEMRAHRRTRSRQCRRCRLEPQDHRRARIRRCIARPSHPANMLRNHLCEPFSRLTTPTFENRWCKNSRYKDGTS